MAGEWTRTTLGELARVHVEQITPSSAPTAVFHHFSIPAFDAGRTPVLELGSAIGSNKFTVPLDAVLISKLNPRISRVWDPVVPTTAHAVASTEFLVLRPRDGVERRFLRFLCQSPAVRSNMEARVTGTSGSHQRVRPEDALTVEVEIPVDHNEQRAIAHILGTLDDKIELNRRMNETLEALARALFQSWFVDFDPVRAKVAGRDPGLPPHLAELFPDAFEDSALGEIPKGWGVQGIDEIANFLNGLALQKYPPGDGATLPVIKIAQLRKGNTEGADRCNTNVPPEYVINDGDVLFSWSGSLECVQWAGDRGALNQHLFKVTSTQFPQWFYYFWVHEHLAGLRYIAAGKATTMGHVQRHHLSDAKVVVPKSDVLDAADKMIAPIFEQVMQRRIESRTFSALRDALLPKLISGELRATGLSLPGAIA